ncbi:MAG: 4Fe-4S binding protein [Verrucomicrobiales bacterium]|jgi:ferredoxin|nr:4Fe-4S binding protein [Verrucomicrobiales bacterium]
MKHLNTLRRIRIAFAVLLIVSVCLAFFDFRDWLPAVFKHTVTGIQFVPAWLSLTHGVLLGTACLVILAVSACFGRVYCSMICPLGILQDIILRIANFLRRKKLFLGYKKPSNKLRYGILAAVIISVAAGWGGFVLAWLDPYSNFGRIAGSLFRPVVIFANNSIADLCQYFQLASIPRTGIPWAGIGLFLPILAIATLIVILAAWRGRLYCNTICPVGSLLGLVSKFSLWKLAIDKSVCQKCGDCLRSCKAQCINLKAGDIDFSRCVACYNCVSVCDEQGIKYRFQNPFKSFRTKKADANDHPNLDRRNFITATATGILAMSGGSLLASVADPKTDTKHDFIHAVLPPGAHHRDRFLSHCTACQLCISACPSHVIESSFLEYGAISGLMKPKLNFNKSFCNFNCTVCGDVCPDNALLPLPLTQKHVTRIGIAHTEHKECIIYRDGTACGACAEHCPTAALQMKKTPEFGEPLPVVDEQYCIGCGACQYACPALPKRAITISGLKSHETAKILVQEKVKAPAANGDFPF